MNEWDSNEKRRGRRGERTERNRTFRVVVLAVERNGDGNKTNTAESEAEACVRRCLSGDTLVLKNFENFLKSLTRLWNDSHITQYAEECAKQFKH